jgi:hypothetical protein
LSLIAAGRNYFNSIVIIFLCAITIRIDISIIETIDAFNVPKSNPPLEIGLVRKSPNVAPNGLVNMKAIQKSIIWFSLVKL